PQAPPGYYDSVDASSAAALRATLHAVVDDHQRFPYTAGGTDTWDILELAQQDPLAPGAIRDVYRNASYAKQGGGNAFYNREHAWPKSYGYPNDVVANYPYTDCHALFLADSLYNVLRDTLVYRDCNAACAEEPTLAIGGQGGGSGAYPGNSNWHSGSGATGAWETWIGRRGDVARALLYLDVRYEGGVHGVTGANEPELVLTDDEGQIAGSATGQNEALAYMGILSEVLAWHAQDPVDDFERDRNDVVFGFQGNRNPFVDHPEWVAVLHQGGAQGPVLSADTESIDTVLGGQQQLALAAGTAHAGRLYFVLGSASGTTPGLFLPPLLPLNLDAYLLHTIQYPNQVVQGSLGFLDAGGSAVASLAVPAGAYTSFAGALLHHAALVFAVPGSGAILAASNAVPLALTAGAAGTTL
ncbi:MAG TPA: endonuclease, partial [Planctomycetota bacterium]|nr:endonuclease [Planctomycetota bacterium]